MFEQSGLNPTAAVIAEFGDLLERRHPSATEESEALVDRLCGFAMAENRTAAAQLMAIGELFAYRLERCSETEDWAVDTEAAVAAEVAAGLRISQQAAAARVRYARTLRERLPETGEAFFAGFLSYTGFTTIVYHTDRVADPEILREVDWQIAVQVSRWTEMTKGKLAAEVDRIVTAVDADAVRRRRERQQQREVWIGHPDEGVTEIGGYLHSTDAKAIDARLNALAATVCPHDTRSREQRRADALGALAAGAERLACDCGNEDCAAGARPASQPVVIHVVAEQATLAGCSQNPASVIGADGLITAELLAELAKTAKLVPLHHPGQAGPEPGYRPSKALADFVRARDLTCRFPGCDVPATRCDIDHVLPYSKGGPTHASNLSCKCRLHHLAKTFRGWQDRQLPDGTLIWTAPTGHTYVTTPGSVWLFPALCAPTADLPPITGQAEPGCGDRGVMMPSRRRTRDQDRAARTAAERAQNHQARMANEAEQSTNYWGRQLPTQTGDDPPF